MKETMVCLKSRGRAEGRARARERERELERSFVVREMLSSHSYLLPAEQSHQKFKVVFLHCNFENVLSKHQGCQKTKKMLGNPTLSGSPNLDIF